MYNAKAIIQKIYFHTICDEMKKKPIHGYRKTYLIYWTISVLLSLARWCLLNKTMKYTIQNFVKGGPYYIRNSNFRYFIIQRKSWSVHLKVLGAISWWIFPYLIHSSSLPFQCYKNSINFIKHNWKFKINPNTSTIVNNLLLMSLDLYLES